jgi:PAB-dependent poly(A)-specific ribonuclease subunit 2
MTDNTDSTTAAAVKMSKGSLLHHLLFLVFFQAGQFVMMNTATESNDSIFMYHVNTGGAPVMSFDVSTSYQSLAFGDGGGYIHLFTSSENAVFNTYSHHPTFADPVRTKFSQISEL